MAKVILEHLPTISKTDHIYGSSSPPPLNTKLNEFIDSNPFMSALPTELPIGPDTPNEKSVSNDIKGSLIPLTPDPEVELEFLSPPNYIPPPPSRFSDKLHTNYIPSTTEIKEIKEYVSTVNNKLSEYDARIAELEAALQEVSTKRAQLHEVKRAHEAIISPLRRLPPEILQIIFVWCLPANRNAVMHASEAPVLLGRVCSEWRRISLATPEVWASLHIVPPNVNFSDPMSSTVRFQCKRELIEMWLARSGACPLSISFVWFAGDSEDEAKLCGSLLEALVPMCGRWKVLDFQVPLKMFKPFMGLTVVHVPLLEGLSLMDNRTPLDADAVDCWPESLAFAESATKLRTFTLTFFSGGIRLPSIPWPQLTTLYLESNIAFFFRDSREMLSSLSACSSLQSCTLKFPLSHTASLPSFELLNIPVTLPQLQILCLDGDQHLHNTFHMCNTLMNLCTPKLRKLEIMGRSGQPDGNNAPEPLSAIKILLQRSKCPLERLNVESLAILPDEFIACLRLVPTLVELVVHNWAVRMQIGLMIGEQEPIVPAPEVTEVTENAILKALTISPKDGNSLERENVNGGKAEVTKEGVEREEAVQTNKTVSSVLEDTTPLCPNLQRFDFMLCDASQDLLCDFVSSRWNDLPEGVARIKSVKCNFTAFEDEAVKKRLQKFRTDGLDAFVTYQVPISDDMNPSPWTGLEGSA